MNEKHEVTPAGELSGQEARRKFLKISGRAALAAPAAALLLSATAKNAAAQVGPYTPPVLDLDATGPA